MKKIYFFLLLAGGMIQAQIVNIPNAVFKAKLLASSTSNQIARDINGANMKIDANNDGNVQVSEAEAVYSLDISGAPASSIQGIESFIHLEKLVLDHNPLPTVDVSMLANLKVLYCIQTGTTSLNVTGLTHMTNLWCIGNGMTSIDVTSLSSLVELRLHENNLTTVDLSGCPLLAEINLDNNNMLSVDFSNNPEMVNIHMDKNSNLLSLDISGLTHLYEINVNGDESEQCALTSLNASGCTSLAILRAEYNYLNSINISGCISLQSVYLNNNQLTTFDASDCPLSLLQAVNNPFEFLFVKNGSHEGLLKLYLHEDEPEFIMNPNIQFICADENQIAAILTMLNTYSITGVVVNSYCSFTPGGVYNTVKGTLHFDADNNGCDLTDSSQSYIKMNLSNSSNDTIGFTDTMGQYTFYVPAGNFEITPEFENQNLFNITPAIANVDFPIADSSISVNDFCIAAGVPQADLEVVVAPIIPARPGFVATYRIVYKNIGSMAVSAAVDFQFDGDRMSLNVSNPMPTTQIPGHFLYNFMNLLPFESRTIYIMFDIHAPTDTPAVNIGDVLTFSGGIYNIGDIHPDDNTSVLHQTVVGSYDPNDITCIEGGNLGPEAIGKYLHYVINFENTGTAAAENIVVKEIIDPAKFDVSSLQILNASHQVDARLNNNILELIFKNIQLETGGHGNILLKIRSNDNLVTGDSVSKKADIFFDYNFPVETNVATTVFSTLSAGDTIKDIALNIYPNPAADVLHVDASSQMRTVELFDVQGRILLTKTISDIKTDIYLSTYSAGVYYLRVTAEKGIKTQKIIKH
ncbi:T9SS type A sorting domain-containing protein [Flavobacterium sp.]|uniref:DUF7619 domain-containing protein n=1 Tax=Flavobacterium sp. TaxID=239 RepID=UPI00261DC511|nr:T9SS type A sorting domain-containing protein [Flavobacterium sp.]